MTRYTPATLTDTYVQTGPEYLTLQSGAQYLSLAVDTLRDRISCGALPAYRSSRAKNARILVRRSDLDALLIRIPTV